MRTLDKITISQGNLWRSKLRTFLTVGAVFIGTFTISLTNGVGNGIKSYVDRQLGNVGADNMLLVSPHSAFANPISSDVIEYDPNRTLGMFNQALLSSRDIAVVEAIRGVTKVTPQVVLQVEYVGNGDKKYEAFIDQFIEGLELEMATGRTLNPASNNEVTIPNRYVRPLGFENPEAAIGKTINIGYKDASGKIIERPVTVVGVMQQSLLGNASIYFSYNLSKEINDKQTAGISRLADTYQNFFVNYDPNFTDEEVEALKSVLRANNYDAQTLQDAIGQINTVINGILVVLNVFSIIALIAAVFGIINTLLMAVTERTSEIGLMKALGANRGSIFSIFAIEAASIGFWGSILAVIISLILAPIVNNLAADNFLKDFVGFELLVFPWETLILTVIGIMVLAFLAGALPSLKASRLDPIKALRYE